MEKLFAILAVCCGLFAFQPCEAAFVFKNGKLIDADEIALYPVEKHYQLGQRAMEARDWCESSRHFLIVATHFPKSDFYQDSLYYLGLSYYHQAEFDFANDSFNAYLKCQSNPKYFEDVISYKFAIAEKFKAGAKRRFFGTRKLPKWAPGKSLATQIYDEVISTLPCHEYAARALFAKGEIHREEEQFKEAVDSLQTLIRRFPKHELTPEAYLVINDIYLEQSIVEFQNPDLLALAQINLKRFQLEFPRDERIQVAQERVNNIQEIYAKGLYETGQFYERTCRSNASIIYYMKAIRQFPETEIAQLCRNRLMSLQPDALDFVNPQGLEKAS